VARRLRFYITEYNTNWAFFKDCCRNDATYAPLFNALYVTDLLDSVYNGVARVSAQMDYFAGSAYPWFCMIGVEDSNSDCLYSVGAIPVPYPQYYVYDLIGSPHYLGLSAGGFMAKSISAPTGGGGLATTAFYTANKDAMVITNPTSTVRKSWTDGPARHALPNCQRSADQLVADLVCGAGDEPDDDDQRSGIFSTSYFVAVISEAGTTPAFSLRKRRGVVILKSSSAPR
jgi:hypothetical protein